MTLPPFAAHHKPDDDARLTIVELMEEVLYGKI